MLNINKQRNILVIITIIMCVLLLFTVRSCNKLKTDLNISNQNILSLSDSVRITKNKVGDLEYSKGIIVSKKRDLENLNANLANELKKEKGKIYELNSYILSIKNKEGDTIYVNSTVVKYANGEYGLDWVYDTIYDTKNSRYISGISKFKLIDSTIINSKTLITRDEIKFNLVTGLREKNDLIEIFVRSDYPGFEALEVDGAIIDPKDNPIIKKFTVERKWHVGPYIGIGFNSNLKPSVQIGVGIQYMIFKF